MRNPILLALFSLTACGAITTEPGKGSGSGSEVGSGMGSGCTSDCPLAVTLSGHVADERGDTISFASGDPIHTHAGPQIDLANGCPDVYKYAYLTDAEAPVWGGETSPNPLAWQVAVQAGAGIDDSGTAYRVRADDGTLLLDWTPIAPDGHGAYTIALHRDGDHAIRALGTRDGGMYLDVRARDVTGHETIATACWKYHPLAAPLEIQPIAADALFGWTLAADSPISTVINASPVPAKAFSQRFVQHTAEPIQLAITLAQPTGQYQDTATSFYLVQGEGTVECGNSSTGRSTDPRCSEPSLHTTSWQNSGALTTGAWTVNVVDDATGAAVSTCTASGMAATCAIPPRQPGTAPVAYRLVAAVNSLGDLAPALGTMAENTVAGRTYTGTYPCTVWGCTRATTTQSNGID